MGKHQWLPNGNLLITESRKGRAFEIDRHGQTVWEYLNVVEEGVVGLIDELQRLPLRYSEILESAKSICGGNKDEN